MGNTADEKIILELSRGSLVYPDLDELVDPQLHCWASLSV